MKAILTIAGESFLIPKTTDLNKILELFQGARRVRHEALFGPEKARYEEPYYISRTVMAHRDQEVSVALVHDDAVMSQSEWSDMTEQHRKACDAFTEKEPISAAG